MSRVTKLPYLDTLYQSFHAPQIDPALRYNGPIPAGGQPRALGSLTATVVIQAGLRAMEWHKAREAEEAAELSAIREGRSQYVNPRPALLDEKANLIAHHRTEAARIQAQVDGLVAPQALAAE